MMTTKQIKINQKKEIITLTGNGTFDIKQKIKKYNFVWNKDEKQWEGNKENLTCLKNYVKNFKSSKIELI